MQIDTMPCVVNLCSRGVLSGTPGFSPVAAADPALVFLKNRFSGFKGLHSKRLKPL